MIRTRWYVAEHSHLGASEPRAATDERCLQGRDAANQNKRKFLADVLAVVSIALNEQITCDVREVRLTKPFKNVRLQGNCLTCGTALVQVVKGRDAAGVNMLLQMLAKAVGVLQLDGVEALRV